MAIDLESDGWPQFKLPYLFSVHASPVTCVQHCSGVNDSFLRRLQEAGDSQLPNCSTRKWPITGGSSETVNNSSRKANKGHDLLLTGHENGSVCFWDLGPDNTNQMMQLIYVLHTAPLFGQQVGGLVPTNIDQSGFSNDEDEEEWPPFRKAGVFDPFSDDPRLAIQKLAICPSTECLVVAGVAGQVLVMGMRDRSQEINTPKPVVAKIVPEQNFSWRGHDSLQSQLEDKIKLNCGFQPSAYFQVKPPAPVTSLALNTDWGVVAVGTAHGLAVFDYIQKREIAVKCTLQLHNQNSNELVEGNFLSRAKTLKKSLRSSIRRLRHGRSDRFQYQNKNGVSAADRLPSPAIIKNEERQIESRQLLANTDESHMTSLVRSLYFSDTFLMSPQQHQPVLIAGTNSGQIFFFQIQLPSIEKRHSEMIQVKLCKELNLKHGAPVMQTLILDRFGTPFSSTQQQRSGSRPLEMANGHFLLVASEEQLKLFTMPNLKQCGKVKITARDGSKLRRFSICDFQSPNNHEFACCYVTNLGEVACYCLPGLLRQFGSFAIPRENINAIISLTFTNDGQFWLLATPSQFACYTLSTAHCIERPLNIGLPQKRLPVLLATSPEKTMTTNGSNNHYSSRSPKANGGNVSVLSKTSKTPPPPSIATPTSNGTVTPLKQSAV